MALIHSLESEGNFLFKYRGQIPVILFLAAIPVLYFTDTEGLSENIVKAATIFAICLSILGLVIRAYTIGTTPKGTSGRNTQEQVAEQLNSSGIYSMVRHPLYLGNYFMWIGIVVFTFNIPFIIIVSLAYWLYYERIMFAEERFLERKFGQQYLDWSLKAPAFIPAFSKFKPSNTPFSMKAVLRREYSGVLATVVGFVFVAFLRDYFHKGVLEMKYNYIYVLIITAAITLILKTLKRYTGLLHEADRS